MTTERIKEIQSKTAYPESVSVQQALLQVWNEVEQEQLSIRNVSGQSEQFPCTHLWKSRFNERRGSYVICSKCSEER